ASIAATAWRPAFSISTSDGIPISSIVRRSASRISCVLSTRIRRAYPHVLDCVKHMALRGAVYVNGTIAGAADAVVPVYDHGVVYGERVYETLRTYNRVPFLYDRHLARLRASAERLQLDVP